jgi:hypothetical protein
MLRYFLSLALYLFVPVALADTLYVTEFPGPPAISVYYQAVNTPAVANQAVTITGASAQSAVFAATTKIIRVHTDTACHVVIGGTNPTATVTSMRLSENATEYFVVTPGQRLAVIVSP